MSDQPPYTTTSIIVSLCSACRTSLHTPPLHHCLPLFSMSDQPPYTTTPSLSPSVQHVGPASIHHHSIIVSLCSACRTSLHTPPLHHCLPQFSMSDQPPYTTTPSLSPSVQHVGPASIPHHSIIVSLSSACQTSLHTPPLHHCLPLFSMSDQPPYTTTPSLSPSVQHVGPASIPHHSIIVSLSSACQTSLHTPPLHHCLPLFSMSDQPPYPTTPSLSPSVQHVRPASIHHHSIIVSLCSACRTSLHTPPLHHCLPLFSMSDQPPYTTTPSLSPAVQHVRPASIHHHSIIISLCSACRTSLHTPPLHHCLPLFGMSDQPPYTTTPSLSPSVQHVRPASIHHHSIIVSLCSACRTSLHTPPLHHCLPLFSMSDQPPYTTTPSLSPSVQHVGPASIHHHSIIVSLCSACRTSLHTPPLHHCLRLFSMSDQPPYTTTPSLSPSVQHVGPASIHHHSIIVSLCSACRTSLHTPPLHHCLPLFSMSDQPPYTTTPSLSPSVQHVGSASIHHHSIIVSLCSACQTSLHTPPLHHCLPLFSMSDQPPYTTTPSLSPSVQHVGSASIHHHSIIVSLCSACRTSLHTPPLHHCLPLFSMSDQPPYTTTPSLSPSVQHVRPASIHHHSIIVSLCSACRTSLHTPPLHHCLPLFSMSDQPPYTTTPSLSPSVQHVGSASIHHHSIIVSLCSACQTSLHTPPLHHCLPLFSMSDQPPYTTTPSLSPSVQHVGPASIHHHSIIVSPLFSMSDQPPYPTTPSLSPSVQHVGPASIHHHSIIVSLCSACRTGLHTPPLHHCLPSVRHVGPASIHHHSIIVSPLFSMSDQPPYTTTPSLSPSVQHVGPASIPHHSIIVSLCSACRTGLHTPPLHHCLPSVRHVGPASIHHHSIIVSLSSACQTSFHTPPLHHCLPQFSMSDQPPYTTTPSLSPSVQHVGPASIPHHSIIVSLCSACQTSLHTPPLHHCLPQFSMSDQPPYTTTPSLSPSVQHVGPASIHHHLHHCLPLFSMSDQPPYTTAPSLSPSVQHVGPASIHHHSIIVSPLFSMSDQPPYTTTPSLSPLCSACRTSLHTPPLHHCLPQFSMSDQPPYPTTPSLSPSVQHVGPASIHHHSIIVSLSSACRTSLHTPPLHHCLPQFSMSDQLPYTTTPSLSPSVQHVGPASIHHHSIIVSLSSACRTSLHTPPLHHCLPLFSMSDQPPYTTTPSLSPSVQHVGPASIHHHSIIVSLSSACRTSLHTPPLHHCLPLFSMSDQPPYTTTPSLSPSVQHVRPASIHHHSIIVSLCSACRTSLHTPPPPSLSPSVQHVRPASIHHRSIIVSLCSACRTSLHTPPLHHCLPSVQHVGPASIHHHSIIVSPLFSMSDQPPYTTTPSLSPLCSACRTSLHTPPLHHCLPSVQHVGPASIHHHSIIVSPLFSMSDQPPYTTTPSLSPLCSACRTSLHTPPLHHCLPQFSMSDQPPYPTTPSLSPSVQHVRPASIHHRSIIVSLCSACRTSLHTPPLHHCLPSVQHVGPASIHHHSIIVSPLFSMSDQPPYTTTPSLSPLCSACRTSLHTPPLHHCLPSVQHVGPASIHHHSIIVSPLFSMSDQPPYTTTPSLSPLCSACRTSLHTPPLHHCLPLFSMSDQPPYTTTPSLSPSVQHVGPASIPHHSIIVSLCSACQTSLHTPPLHHCLPLFSMSDQPPYTTTPSLSPSVQHVGPASIHHHSIIVSPLFSMSDQPPYTTTPSLSPSVQHVRPASIHHHSIIVSLSSACQTSLHTPPLHHCLPLFSMSDQPPYTTTSIIVSLCSACQTSLHTPPLHHCLPLFSMSDQPPYATTSIIVSLCSACRTSLHTPPLHHCLPSVQHVGPASIHHHSIIVSPLFSMSDQPPYTTTPSLSPLCSACRTSLHTPPPPSLSPSVQHVGPASIRHHSIIVSLCSACRTSLHTPPLHHCLPLFSMSDQPPYATTSIIVSLCSACRTSLHTPPLHHCLPLFSMSDQPPYATTPSLSPLCSACRTGLHTPPLHHCLPLLTQ